MYKLGRLVALVYIRQLPAASGWGLAQLLNQPHKHVPVRFVAIQESE